MTLFHYWGPVTRSPTCLSIHLDWVCVQSHILVKSSTWTLCRALGMQNHQNKNHSCSFFRIVAKKHIFLYKEHSSSLRYLYLGRLDILFSSNHNIKKSPCGLCFGLQTLSLIDFTKIFLLKGLKPKNKGHTNFYECCDLTKKVYLYNVF